MSDVIWDSDDWEQHVHCLCRLRHGHKDYVPVPDQHGGDLGIEGFSTDGVAYQAYAPETRLGVKELYEAQRDKITRDLEKFSTKNCVELKKLLGGTIIARWILITPSQVSKDLIKHANSKAEMIRTLSLSYVAADFRVMIQTEEDFPTELATVVGIVHATLPTMATAPPDGTVVTGWKEENSILTSNLVGKISDLKGKIVDAEDQLVEKLTLEFLHSENILHEFHLQQPSSFERLRAALTHREGMLEVEVATCSTNAKALRTSQVEGLKGDLQKAVPRISVADLDKLAWGTVGKWLLQCPLNFSELSQ